MKTEQDLLKEIALHKDLYEQYAIWRKEGTHNFNKIEIECFKNMERVLRATVTNIEKKEKSLITEIKDFDDALLEMKRGKKLRPSDRGFYLVLRDGIIEYRHLHNDELWEFGSGQSFRLTELECTEWEIFEGDKLAQALEDYGFKKTKGNWYSYGSNEINIESLRDVIKKYNNA